MSADLEKKTTELENRLAKTEEKLLELIEATLEVVRILNQGRDEIDCGLLDRPERSLFDLIRK